MKHKLSILAVISMLLLMLVAATTTAEEVVPYANGSNSLSIQFTISGSGTATASAGATTLASGTYPKITIYIQTKVGSDWVTVKTGSGGREAEITYQAEKGINYRGRAVLKVYNSNDVQIDSLSINSNARAWN